MKPYASLVVSIFVLSSCNLRKESSNITGRTDEVYFTVNDTRKPEEYKPNNNYSGENNLQDRQNTGNTNSGYTNTYADRLRYFGTMNTYYYDSYRPSIVPSIYYNYYSGWNVGLTFVNPRYGYISGFNSPFSPYFGLNMPYYDPFYANNWCSGMWMNSMYPRYYFNPYYYNPCFYGYGYNSYYYPYYNPYYSNFYNNSKPNYNNGNANSVRRTGTSNNIPSSNNSSTTQPQNSSQNNNNQNNTGNRWYGSGNNDRGGSSGSSGSTNSGGSGGGSGSNSDRGSSGSGGSTRRR